MSRSKSRVSVHENDAPHPSKPSPYDNGHQRPMNRASMSNTGSTMNRSKDNILVAAQKKKNDEADRNILREKSKDKASFNPSRSLYEDSKIMATDADLLKTQNSYYGQQQTKTYFKDHRVSQKAEHEVLREKQSNVQLDEKDLRKSVQSKGGLLDQVAKNQKSYLGGTKKDQPAPQISQNNYGMVRKKTISDLNAYYGNENLYGQRAATIQQGQLVRNKSTSKTPIVK